LTPARVAPNFESDRIAQALRAQEHYYVTAPATKGRLIRWASGYDVLIHLLFLGKEQSFRAFTVDLAGIKPGHRVLDVGCGTGNLTKLAAVRAGRQGQAHGIDAAPEMIARAKLKAARQQLEIDYRVAPIEDLPFPNDHFDVVLSSLMLHHLPADLAQLGFAEVGRVLKPGGRLAVVDLALPIVGRNLRLVERLMRETAFTEIETGRTPRRIIRYLCGTTARAAA
jgi:demethylmenaquinone methyltransferase/2-methoxy-6-polyprenyl-1,4-benzoquinol methylase/phosphoethanolamine N-methyltransferase